MLIENYIFRPLGLIECYICIFTSKNVPLRLVARKYDTFFSLFDWAAPLRVGFVSRQWTVFRMVFSHLLLLPTHRKSVTCRMDRQNRILDLGPTLPPFGPHRILVGDRRKKKRVKRIRTSLEDIFARFRPRFYKSSSIDRAKIRDDSSSSSSRHKNWKSPPCVTQSQYYSPASAAGRTSFICGSSVFRNFPPEFLVRNTFDRGRSVSWVFVTGDRAPKSQCSILQRWSELLESCSLPRSLR